MQKNPVGWFEIPVTDMNRARKFYEELFGKELDLQEEKGGYQMAWFPWEEDSYGSAGTLMKGEGYTPSHDGTTIYFTAAEMEDMLERVESIGGKVLVPKKDIGEHGFIAWVEDTEGNRIALHKRK